MLITIDILIIIMLFILLFNFIIDFGNRFRRVSFFQYLIMVSIIIGSIYEDIGLGGDYDNYRNIFTMIDYKSSTAEIGFHYLNLLIRQITDNFYIAFLIFMFIINFFTLKAIYEHSKQVELSIIVYIIVCGYVTSANIVRQCIAGAIYYYSIKFLFNNQYIKFIILGIIAFTFHTTVVIPFIITFIISVFNNKLNKNFEIYFICINSLIVIEPIIRRFGLALIDKGYTESSFNYGSNILHYVVQLAFVSFYYINREKISDAREKMFMNLSVIALGFVLLSQAMVLYARFATYFMLFNAILTSNVLIKIKNGKKKRLYYYLFSVGLCIYYLLLTSKGLSSYSGNYIVDFLNQLL